jgi:hypothetical protein
MLGITKGKHHAIAVGQLRILPRQSYPIPMERLCIEASREPRRKTIIEKETSLKVQRGAKYDTKKDFEHLIDTLLS